MDGIQVALLGRECKSFNDIFILNEGLEFFLHGFFPACMSYSFRVGFRFHFRINERKKMRTPLHAANVVFVSSFCGLASG
jgi:hypothetical protein